MSLRGYRRSDGRAGIRNLVVVMAAADNVNPLVYALAAADARIVPVPATFGRGQLGADFDVTIRAMANLAVHPNVYRTLVLSFEPESAARIVSHARCTGRTVDSLAMLDLGGKAEIMSAATTTLRTLLDEAHGLSTVEIDWSDITLGLECGGSDATSGLVANPALGLVADRALAAGATAIFSEPLELSGCEPMLDRRARTPAVAAAMRAAIAKYHRIALDAGIDLTGTNPTPDNIAGGLSSIEEKALGAIAKSGSAPIEGVLAYAESPHHHGLWLMDAPAAAVENLTALAAGGCNVIAFTTGSVNPIGNPIAPTIKICGNPAGVRQMHEHVDVDVSPSFDGRETLAQAGDRIYAALVATLGGSATAAERSGFLETRVSRIGASV